MSKDARFRIERDSHGSVRIPVEALYGAHTQRALENFRLSGMRLPRDFIRALALIKSGCAEANAALGCLPADVAQAVIDAAAEVEIGRHDSQFPVDVFQTGSGTSTNMNANEVIARLAAERVGRSVHANDDVNRSQSSNDVIPTAIHVSAALALREQLFPALDGLAENIDVRASEFADVVKTGRTHLMDALPITLGQELSGWASQVRQGTARLQAVLPRLYGLAQGGTAVGTGMNTPAQFAERFCEVLNRRTRLAFRPAPNTFEALAAQDTAVELSGQLRVIAVSLMKIANDLRWMNSGPQAGLGEIRLPALQPGSSIMPGKVNPVIPEAVAMICAQVMGNDVTVGIAGQSGNFQLNVMLPVIAHNLLQSITLLANGARSLADDAVSGFTVERHPLARRLERNPILVTALTPVIGYDAAAAIAKRAYAEGRPVLDVADEMTDLGRDELARLLDPGTLAHVRA